MIRTGKASLALVALVLLAQAGCSRCARAKPEPATPVVEPEPPVPEVPWKDLAFAPDDSMLLVGIVGEPWAEDPVTVHALRVTERGVEVGQALGLPRRGREIPAVAAHGKHILLARGTGVERREPFVADAGILSLNLGQPPASILGLGDGCLVGLEGRVDYVDFSGTEPDSRVIFEDGDLGKPVDFLVPLGERAFAAVDDELAPKYVAVFDLDPADLATHRFTAELPSAPNERYQDVTVLGGDLVITSSYGVMHGSGNMLYRWLVDKREAPGLPREEYLPRMAGDGDARTRLLAGDVMTYWYGLGVIGDHLFIGAAERGILHMPAGAQKGELHDVSGVCLDLLVAGGRVLALVADAETRKGETVPGRRHIVELAWDPGEGKLAERARHALAVDVTWIAR